MTGARKLRLIMVVIAMSAVCIAGAWADPPSQVARLSYISGSVSFQPGNLDEWTPAMLNYPLTEGDRLWTDDGSRAELHVRAGAIRLNSNTEFSFLNLDDESIQVRVSEGSLNVILRGVDNGTAFEIDTPNAAISLLSAGSYRIDVQSSGQTSLVVRSGKAEVIAGGDDFDVNEGRSTVISGLDSISYYVAAVPGLDEWDSWSADRDRRDDQVASNPRLSREMIGSEDLDENGTWRQDASYGPVWAPSNVPADWAPYRFGHWAWVEPWGWTWMDNASWGFAPFHYGRWAYLNTRWSWIPGAPVARPVYAPALVVFVGGDSWRPAAGDGIGWFPLGPREVYLPPYKASTEYVQRINVTHVTNITVQIIEKSDSSRTVYANRNAPRAVTFVPRDVFVQSRPAERSVLSITPAETSRAPLMGMTAKIVPQRESIIAKPPAARAPVRQPPAATITQRVYSRAAPPPVQVPFVQQQKALVANPGKPVDPAALAGMQRGQQAPARAVTVVNTAALVRQKNPPVTPQAAVQQKTAAPVAVAPQPVVKPVPAVQEKPVTPVAVAPQPVVKPVPAVQEKPVTPVAVAPQPVVKPVPAVQQKPVTPVAVAPQPVVKPVPAVQKPVNPAPVDRQPAARPAPAVQQKPVVPVAVAPQPVVKPAPAMQQKPVAPVAVAPQPVVKPAPAMQQKPATPAMQQKPVPSAAASKTGSSASTLLATLRTRTLPDAEQRLSDARKVAGIHLDFNAVSQQLASAKQALADADKDLAAGNSDQALQKGIAAQKKIEDQANQVSAAVQDSKKGPQKP